MSIPIAAGETHPPVDAQRFATENPIHDALTLDELLPVETVQGSQAADAVLHRDPIGGLVLRVPFDQILDRVGLLGQPTPETPEREMVLGKAALQLVGEAGDERRGA